MRLNLGDDYIDRVFARFPDVKDSVDFCAYWFRLADDQISENGRAELVGTSSISQGKSQIAALDYVVQNDGVIYDAVSTQVWSGEANVHVSIVNWLKLPSSSPVFDEDQPSPLAPLPRRARDKDKLLCYLNNQPVPYINSSLKSIVDASQAVRLQANLNWRFQGVIPLGVGFLIDEKQVSQ